jgi:hypothetical protein
MIKDFLKAAKNSGPLAIEMLRVRFHRGTMNAEDKAAYDQISKTCKQDSAKNEIHCTVPAGTPDNAAKKALLVLRLEYGRDWKVISDQAPKSPAPPKP